jgi:hypothetical protein
MAKGQLLEQRHCRLKATSLNHSPPLLRLDKPFAFAGVFLLAGASPVSRARMFL